MQKIAIWIVLIFVPAHANICVSSLWFSINLFFIMGHIFMLHQMPDDVLLDTRCFVPVSACR